MPRLRKIPLLPGDPGFSQFMETTYLPAFTPATKSELIDILSSLDTDRNVEQEINELERQAALTRYRVDFFHHKDITLKTKEKLVRDVLRNAEKLRESLAALVGHSIIPKRKNSETSLPERDLFKYSLHDLEEAIDEMPYRLVDALEEIQLNRDNPAHEDKVAPNRNNHRIAYIDMCIRCWFRNGGLSGFNLQRIASASKKGEQYEIVGGLVAFVQIASKEVLTGAALAINSSSTVREHFREHENAILWPRDAEDPHLRSDPDTDGWGGRSPELGLPDAGEVMVAFRKSAIQTQVAQFISENQKTKR